MRSFERSLKEFESRGVRVVAISVDPPAVNHDHCRKQGYTFTFLSDPSAATIRAYGVLHEKAGPDGHDIARPAEFLVDAAGTVRWVNLTESITFRARPAQVLRAIEETRRESTAGEDGRDPG